MGMNERPVREGIEVYENGDDSYLYLPGQLLVDAAHEKRAEAELDGRIQRKRPMHDRLDVSHYDIAGDLHDTVETLRKLGVRCGPNHVLAGEPRYIGGPATIIEPTDYGLTEPAGCEGEGVTIAVLDTGFRTDVQQWLVDRVDTDAPDEPLDKHNQDGDLDHEAGHGTFIAGVIADIAPGAKIIARQVLESDGFGDEAKIAQTISDVVALAPDVINLSLGAYTHGNLPPVGLANALRQVDRTKTVVVAAAGNAGRDVPFWPAALKQVWSVAAVDDDGMRACFSNFGHWVDCGMKGVDIKSCFPDWNGGGPGPFTNGWAMWSGTSFAAPRLAGLIAREMTDSGTRVPATEAVHRVLARASRIDPLIGAIVL
jgi:subtilase family protein